MKAGHRTDLGRVRSNNEDSLLVDDALGLYAVADGMGGMSGGEVASALAVQTVSRRVRRDLAAAADREGVYTLLMGVLVEAHETIKARTVGDRELAGMGTTIVVALRHGGFLYVAHVGDSRAYLVREGGIRQLTEDHSVVAQIVKSGMMTSQEARSHRLRHVLSQALGSATELAPSIQSLELHRGDYVLLCSDGLTDMLGDTELLGAVMEHDGNLAAACSRLVEDANRSGGRDNVSVILLAED